MRGAGFPQGPFEHIDLIGLDVNLATSTAVYAGLGSPARLAPSALQARLVAARRLGRKRGVGFYEYDAWDTGSARARASDDAVASTSPLPPVGHRSPLRLSLANEAYLALGDGVATADRIDVALRMGAAHPQGPLEWAIAQGLDAVHAELRRWRPPRAAIFAPAPALVEAAATR